MNQKLEDLPEMRWVLAYDQDGKRTLAIVGQGKRAEVVLSDKDAKALADVLLGQPLAPKTPVYR